ncbi:hypothetical protein [Calidifontibacter indicus]|uniref:phage major capsid protein n=1 Tax=Calidifontibacter indicus TaxID=419650 RepID=UPI003D7056CE
MAGITYPGPAPVIEGDVLKIHAFMKSPQLIARRLRSLLQQRYIADAVLTQRLKAQGGAVLYETGDTLFTGEDARKVAPGGEYPIVTVGGAVLAAAKTDKWGQDALVTDESIARQLRNPVDRGLNKLANQNVKTVDSVAMAVALSAVTQTETATASWATATGLQIFGDVTRAASKVRNLNEGYNPDRIALSDPLYTAAMLAFAGAGLLPREQATANPFLTGQFPNIGGYVWLPSPNTTGVLVYDSEQLGGMADEDLGSPGYVKASGEGTAPVEVKTIRDDDNDRYRARARRVTVPVVLEPLAGIKVVGA